MKFLHVLWCNYHYFIISIIYYLYLGLPKISWLLFWIGALYCYNIYNLKIAESKTSKRSICFFFSGHVPFEANTFPELVEKILTSDMPPPRVKGKSALGLIKLCTYPKLHFDWQQTIWDLWLCCLLLLEPNQWP